MRVRTIALAILAAGAFLSSPLAAQQPAGQATFREHCKACHGIAGIPPAREQAKYAKLRTLGDSGFVSALSVDSIVTILTNGIDKNMKSFATKLTAEEMRAVATFTKALADKKAAARGP